MSTIADALRRAQGSEVEWVDAVLRGPGYFVIPNGARESHEQRRRMIDVARSFTEHGEHLEPVALMRFDQQLTTRWHIDGGPDRCVLMLGYEPTAVRSELMLTALGPLAHELALDFSAAAHAAQSGAHDTWLDARATRLELDFDAYPIVLVNNSTTEHGLLHRVRIQQPDPSTSRIVNSALFALSDSAAQDDAEEREFIERTDVLR